MVWKKTSLSPHLVDFHSITARMLVGCNHLLNSKEGAAIFHYSVKMFHLLLNHAHYFGEIKYPKSFPKPVLCSWVNNNSRQHLAKKFPIQFFPSKTCHFPNRITLIFRLKINLARVWYTHCDNNCMFMYMLYSQVVLLCWILIFSNQFNYVLFCLWLSESLEKK